MSKKNGRTAERHDHINSFGNSTASPFRINTKRERRALLRLLASAAMREEIDNEAGCSNGPDLVLNLRERGLELPCKRLSFKDRDGKWCHPGLYRLTAADRVLVAQALTSDAGFIDPHLAGLLAVLAAGAALWLAGGAL